MYCVKSLFDTNLISLFIFREFSGLSLNHQGLIWVRVASYLTSRQPWFKKPLVQYAFLRKVWIVLVTSCDAIIFFFKRSQLCSYKHHITQQNATWTFTFLNILENVMSYVIIYQLGINFLSHAAESAWIFDSVVEIKSNYIWCNCVASSHFPACILLATEDRILLPYQSTGKKEKVNLQIGLLTLN